jgi:hypothetical protein
MNPQAIIDEFGWWGEGGWAGQPPVERHTTRVDRIEAVVAISATEPAQEPEWITDGCDQNACQDRPLGPSEPNLPGAARFRRIRSTRRRTAHSRHRSPPLSTQKSRSVSSALHSTQLCILEVLLGAMGYSPPSFRFRFRRRSSKNGHPHGAIVAAPTDPMGHRKLKTFEYLADEKDSSGKWARERLIECSMRRDRAGEPGEGRSLHHHTPETDCC